MKVAAGSITLFFLGGGFGWDGEWKKEDDEELEARSHEFQIRSFDEFRSFD
jgi:hypothetical protein